VKPVRAVLCLVAGLAAAATASAPDFRQMLRDRTPANPRPLPAGLQGPSRNSRATHAAPVPGLDSTIRDDFPCNDDVTGGCDQVAPKMATDSRGGFVVSWYEFRDGDADAWFQRCDSAGNRIGPNARLNTDATLGWQGDPSSAMAPQGEFLVCWEDRRDIGNSDLFCQRFDSSGARLADNFRVSDSAADGDQSYSGAWTNPAGLSLLAWDDRRNGLTGDIFAQFLNPDGTPLRGNFRVNDDGVGEANQYEPEVSGDDSGRFVVAWMDGRGQGGEDWNVFCQRFDAQGDTLGVNIQVTTDNLIQWSPSVACSRTGRFLVTFDDQRNTDWDVYAQAYDERGSPIGANFRVSDNAGTSDQFGSTVACNAAGEYLVAWADRRNGNDDVFARRFDSDGSPLGASFRVNDDAGSQPQGSPTVAARPDNGFWVAWSDSRAGDNDIYCQRLQRNGSPVGANFRINDDTASSLQRVSSIGMERSGGICVAWEDERNGSTDIYRALLDESGAPVGANLRLNDDGQGGAGQYYVSVAGGSGRYVAAWVDCRAGRDSTDIYAQFLDASGQPSGANFRVSSGSSPSYQWYPYCAMDSANNAAIVFMDTRNGPYQYFRRRYDATGSPVGPEELVQDTLADGYYGSCAMNRSGRFVVAWMDMRNGAKPDVYCQPFRADGSRIGRNIKVNTDTGQFYQGYPSCVVAEDGRFAVAWEETRNLVYDVYLQWFDSTGARLGGEEKVNDNTGGGAMYSPSCAMDSSGRLAVMFNDERDYPGNPQVYCQRFRPDRSRISGNRVVNGPILFPKNSHWTVGQSIAASSSVLAFAWTDNRRHQGFDIFAKLTDWDLVGVEESPPAPAGRRGVLPGLAARNGKVRVTFADVATIWDASGRMVLRAKPERGSLSLRGLAPGAYFVTAGRGSGRPAWKLVVE
jgi:hypothetical protein